MNRNDRKLLKIAEERGGSIRKIRNKLYRSVSRSPSQSLAGIPVGRTVVIRNNEIIWSRKKTIPHDGEEVEK